MLSHLLINFAEFDRSVSIIATSFWIDSSENMDFFDTSFDLSRYPSDGHRQNLFGYTSSHETTETTTMPLALNFTVRSTDTTMVIYKKKILHK